MLEIMPKLWIVHRSPQQRASLARLSGLAESDLLEGAPTDSSFASHKAPAALVLGLDGDFELELDFVHRHRRQLAQTHWLLITQPADATEAERLFRAVRPEIQKGPPSARSLRAFIAAAISHRNAASLAERQHRARISERFSLWLGGVEVPGLLRALDPSLSALPLLVRGVPGSGRSLLCHYVEIFRGARGPVLRLHGRDLHSPGMLLQGLSESKPMTGGAPRSIWVDEIDSLSIAEQRELAELIQHGSAEIDLDTTNLRWIATAGPSGPDDSLESSLEHAFAPLAIEIPSLLDHPETLASFAAEVAADWTSSVGGVPREFADSALVTLEVHPWTGDRAELEAVLRTSLAASSREVLEDVDLRFPTDPAPWASTRPTRTSSSSSSTRADRLEAEGEDVPVYVSTPRSAGADAIDTLIEVDAEDGDGDEIGEAVFADAPASHSLADSSTREDLAPDENTSLAEAAFDLARDPAVLMQAPETPPTDEGLGWRRLARSLSHEIRNPLVSIRTFTELLPEHFEDETFRTRFTELVGRDVAHISDVLSRLSSIAEREKFVPEPVDVSALIEALLEERRERITGGRLLVLRELERDAPLAWADSRGLQIALAGLLDRALEALPERGDLFVATRHLERGADGQPKLRILLRHHNPMAGQAGDSSLSELDPRSNILEYVLAETVVVSCGGTLTIDATDAQETLILVDLQTPN
jgi:DNA-binding NtrC family response regulator